MVTFVLINPERKISAIAILIPFRGKKYKRSIKESVETKLWNKTRKRARETTDHPEYSLLNYRIGKWHSAAERTLSHFKEYYNPPTTDQFFAILDKEYYKDEIIEPMPVLFLDYLRKYIERYEKVRHKRTVANYNLLVKNLEAYERARKKKLTFEHINIDFYNDFQEWFYSNGYSANYFGSQVKIIKQIYKEARDTDKLHNSNETDHKDFITIKKDTESIYLTTEELLRIHNLDITAELLKEYKPDLNNEQVRQKLISLPVVRDRFLIGAFTGLRVSDFGRLSDAHIGEFIRIITTKTKQPVVIPIHPVIKEIISHGFDFCVVVSDQKINEHIKEIAELAKIDDVVLVNKNKGGKIISEDKRKWELVTTHTARRSFATNAYKSGVPTLAIMKITGHKTEASFLRYIKVSAEENAQILMKHPFFNMAENAEHFAVPNVSEDMKNNVR